MGRFLFLLAVTVYSCLSSNAAWKQSYKFEFWSGEEKPVLAKKNLLYLKGDELHVHCQIYDPDNDTPETRLHLAYKYQVLGHFPSITIKNSTWIRTFQFESKVENSSRAWIISIPRSGISEKVVHTTEEWQVVVELDTALGLFNTEGSLLDLEAEPILHWNLSNPLSPPSLPNGSIADILISRSPCAPDVAMVAPVFQTDYKHYGILIGITMSSFHSPVTWYNLSTSEAVCSAVSQGCSNLELLDLVLTNKRLLLLTNHGLVVSEDLTDKLSATLNFTLIDPLIGISGNIFKEGKGSRNTSHLHYTPICINRQQESFIDDVVFLVIKEAPSTVLISTDSFMNWTSPFTYDVQDEIISVEYNNHMRTAALLTKTDTSYQAQFLFLTSDLSFEASAGFAPYVFPSSFKATGLVFDPFTYMLYAFGNRVWLSEDGGNYFKEMYASSDDDQVVMPVFGHGDILFKTVKGRVLYGKTGILRLATIIPPAASIATTLPFIDHLGQKSVISVTTQPELALTPAPLDVESLVKSNLEAHNISSSLAIQYITESEVVFFEYTETQEPGFHAEQIGEVLNMRKGGSGLIQKISFGVAGDYFVSRIHVSVLYPFHYEHVMESPAQRCAVNIRPVNGTKEVEATLVCPVSVNGHWLPADHMKTVWAIGSVSFLVTSVINDTVIHGIAVTAFREEVTAVPGQWCMFNFGSTQYKGQSSWYLSEQPCHHNLVPDPFIKQRSSIVIDLGDTVSFSVTANLVGSYPVPSSSDPLIHVTFSNPLVFQVDTSYTRKLGYQTLQLTVEGKRFERAASAITFHMPSASLLCSRASFTVYTYVCCPQDKHLVFHYPITISDEDYLRGEPVDKHERPLLYTLPINYRPPSSQGIAIPMNDHIYNADPSKPRYNEKYKVSKETGHYKQCAGKQSRSECMCTDKMKLSQLVEFSDCKERVYRMLHPGRVVMNFTIQEQGQPEYVVSEPYIIKVREINNRKDYALVSGSSPMLQSLKGDDRFKDSDQYFSAEGTEVKMTGSGLYHFEVHVINGFSYCTLKEELQFFIDMAPIPYPSIYIINLAGAVVLGGVLMVIYLYYLYYHHTQRVKKTGSQCQELHSIAFQNVKLKW